MIRDTTSSRVLLGALLVGALGLAVVDSHSGSADSPLHPVRVAAATALGPVESGVMHLVRPIAGTVSALGRARSQDRRIADLQAQNMALATRLRTALDGAGETAALRGLSASAVANSTTLRPAHVIAAGPTGAYSWTVAIDAGSRDGVRVNTAVLEAAGLVGRVVSVTPSTATVMLLIDPISSVGVRSAGNGAIGTLDGTGDELCRLTMFDRQAKLVPGDELVTYGSVDQLPYASGLPVGRVVSVTPAPGTGASVILVRPYNRFGTLDTVGVVVPTGTGTDRVAAQGATR